MIHFGKSPAKMILQATLGADLAVSDKKDAVAIIKKSLRQDFSRKEKVNEYKNQDTTDPKEIMVSFRMEVC